MPLGAAAVTAAFACSAAYSVSLKPAPLEEVGVFDRIKAFATGYEVDPVLDYDLFYPRLAVIMLGSLLLSSYLFGGKAGTASGRNGSSGSPALAQRVFAAVVLQLATTASAVLFARARPLAFSVLLQYVPSAVLTYGPLAAIGLMKLADYTENRSLKVWALVLFTGSMSAFAAASLRFVPVEALTFSAAVTVPTTLGLVAYARRAAENNTDLSPMGAWLYSTLLGMLGVALVEYFVPSTETFVGTLAFAVIGVGMWSGFIVYDTFRLLDKRGSLRGADWIDMSTELYLDIVGLAIDLVRLYLMWKDSESTSTRSTESRRTRRR